MYVVDTWSGRMIFMQSMTLTEKEKNPGEEGEERFDELDRWTEGTRGQTRANSV